MKLSTKQKNKYKKDLQKLIVKTLKTKKRSKKTYLGVNTLTKGTGNLFSERNIRPTFKINGGELSIDVEMMDYFEYLEGGTVKIKPWFFSEDIMDSKEIADITEDLLASMIDDVILDMQSKIKKSK